jgi:hypothetical protein
MRRLQLAMAMLCAATSALPVHAQQYGRNADPNLGHFYMGRQQVTITDDSPQVNDQRTQPAPPGQQGAAGGVPNRPVALPRASFAQYSNNLPTLQGSLPRTVNGVPPKAPPNAGVSPKMAKTGAYKNKQAAVAKAAPSGPPVLKSYAPVQGYGAGAQSAPRPVSASAGGSSSTAVRGSLLNQSGTSALHWSRTRSN